MNTASESLKSNFQYIIEKITVIDSENVINFLKQFFYKDSPLYEALNITTDECSEAFSWSIKCINENHSFKAIIPDTGEIIGVILNDIWHQKSINETINETAHNKKLIQLLNFCNYVDTKVQLFDLYPEYDTALYINKISVNTNYRNLGIAQKLLNATMDYMDKLELEICQITCTNYYLLKLLLKSNFNVIHVEKFENYVVNGVKSITTEAPHTDATVLIKIINKNHG